MCYIHGGAAPQVRLAAKERLAILVDPAITRLEQLMKQTEFPCTAYAAVKDVLDRAGLKPTDSFEHTIVKRVQAESDEELFANTKALLEKIERRQSDGGRGDA